MYVSHVAGDDKIIISVFSTPSHRRGGSVVEPSSDSSTAKRLATGASVTGPLR